MTKGTAHSTMPFCKREKAVFEIFSIPAGSTRGMALGAIGGVSRLLVVGTGGGQIGTTVAIHTFGSKGIKTPG